VPPIFEHGEDHEIIPSPISFGCEPAHIAWEAQGYKLLEFPRTVNFYDANNVIITTPINPQVRLQHGTVADSVYVSLPMSHTPDCWRAEWDTSNAPSAWCIGTRTATRARPVDCSVWIQANRANPGL
jgi:hypothetical protein